MTTAYVCHYYGVPAARGRRVTYNGRPGRITSADHRLCVRFDGDTLSSIIHPTEDGLVYLDEDGKQLWPAPDTEQETNP